LSDRKRNNQRRGRSFICEKEVKGCHKTALEKRERTIFDVKDSSPTVPNIREARERRGGESGRDCGELLPAPLEDRKHHTNQNHTKTKKFKNVN
jgi:hypothetical protein